MTAGRVDFWDNEESAELLGWDPTWLDLPPDLDLNDEIVSDAVAAAQEWHGQPASGVLDAVTWQRLEFLRTLDRVEDIQPATPTDYVIFEGKRVPIPFEVVTPDDYGGMGITQRYKYKGRWRQRYGSRSGSQIDRAVVHWTGTKTPQHSFRAAWNTPRGVSTDFEIGDDGTIFQLKDLAFSAYHSGKTWLNRSSIGIDLTLAPVRKDHEAVNDALEALGLKRRPIVDGVKVRGWRPGPFLGATPEQLDSLRKLMRMASSLFGVPMTSPDDIEDPGVVRAVCRIKDATPKTIPPGWYHHANFKEGRWDTCCVDLPRQLQLA